MPIPLGLPSDAMLPSEESFGLSETYDPERSSKGKDNNHWTLPQNNAPGRPIRGICQLARTHLLFQCFGAYSRPLFANTTRIPTSQKPFLAPIMELSQVNVYS